MFKDKVVTGSTSRPGLPHIGKNANAGTYLGTNPGRVALFRRRLGSAMMPGD